MGFYHVEKAFSFKKQREKVLCKINSREIECGVVKKFKECWFEDGSKTSLSTSAVAPAQSGSIPGAPSPSTHHVHPVLQSHSGDSVQLNRANNKHACHCVYLHACMYVRAGSLIHLMRPRARARMQSHISPRSLIHPQTHVCRCICLDMNAGQMQPLGPGVETFAVARSFPGQCGDAGTSVKPEPLISTGSARPCLINYAETLAANTPIPVGRSNRGFPSNAGDSALSASAAWAAGHGGLITGVFTDVLDAHRRLGREYATPGGLQTDAETRSQQLTSTWAVHVPAVDHRPASPMDWEDFPKRDFPQRLQHPKPHLVLSDAARGGAKVYISEEIQNAVEEGTVAPAAYLPAASEYRPAASTPEAPRPPFSLSTAADTKKIVATRVPVGAREEQTDDNKTDTAKTKGEDNKEVLSTTHSIINSVLATHATEHRDWPLQESPTIGGDPAAASRTAESSSYTPGRSGDLNYKTQQIEFSIKIGENSGRETGGWVTKERDDARVKKEREDARAQQDATVHCATTPSEVGSTHEVNLCCPLLSFPGSRLV